MPTQQDLTRAEQQELHSDLLGLQQELRELLELSREGAKPVALDEPIGRLSRMDAMQQQSMAMATRGATQSRLRQTAAALRRHQEDEYGDCLVCGEAVGYARLKVAPESTLCVGCQSKRERSR